MKRVNLDLRSLSSTDKLRAKQTAGSIIVNEIQSSLDRSQSPVKNGRYKSKLASGGSSILFEDGDLRGHITYAELVDADAIEVGVFNNAPSLERTKAFAHNTGFRGHPHLDSQDNKREFIPSPNKRFDESIMNRVDGAVEAIRTQSILEDELIQRVLDDSLLDELL